MVHNFYISLGRLDYDGTHLARVPGHILNTLASEWRIGLMDTEQTPTSWRHYCTAYNPAACLGGEQIWPPRATTLFISLFATLKCPIDDTVEVGCV